MSNFSKISFEGGEHTVRDNRLDGVSSVSYGIASGRGHAFTVTNGTKAVLFVAGNGDNRNGIYLIAVTTGGVVAVTPVVEAGAITIDDSVNNRIAVESVSAVTICFLVFGHQDDGHTITPV